MGLGINAGQILLGGTVPMSKKPSPFSDGFVVSLGNSGLLADCKYSRS